MADNVFPIRLFTATTVNATAAVTSGVIDVSALKRLESLILTMTSTANAHDVKVQMVTAASATGTFTDVTDLVTLTSSTATDFPNSATDAIALSLPTALGPFVKFIVTGVGANPADTSLTAVLMARE